MGEAPTILDMTDYISSDSNHLTANDFVGEHRICVITEARPTGNKERPVLLFLEGEEKAYLPCKTVRRLLTKLWPDASKRAGEEYPGRAIRLYYDENVTWAGKKVGGIRIDGASHIPRDTVIALPESEKKLREWHIMRLEITKKPAAPTLTDRIANAERILSELAPLRLETLQERSGDMEPREYLKALADLHADVTGGGA
jgi:hypothetical protein